MARGDIIIMRQTRPCAVMCLDFGEEGMVVGHKEEPYVWHDWIVEDGHTKALVEDENGKITSVSPYDIRFLDDIFKDYDIEWIKEQLRKFPV